MNHIMTEREWRKQRVRSKRAAPPCWGAQCVTRPSAHPLTRDRGFRVFLLMLSLMISVALPSLVPKGRAAVRFDMARAPAPTPAPKVRAVSDIGYALPNSLSYYRVTFTREELLRGKFLLLDAEHPLPKDVPAPNTFSVANIGRGMVPVADFSVKCGKEAVAALTRMFTAFRERGVDGLIVWRGTVSVAQQRDIRLKELQRNAARMPLKDALRLTLDVTETPGTGELLQEYAVDIRLNVEGSRSLQSTPQGRYLLQNAWRYGFVLCGACDENAQSVRLRYIGEAHAAAMTYLNLDMMHYLEHLREKRVITVRMDGAMRYLILYEPMLNARFAFSIPLGALYEASLDNLGGAVAACTL